MKILISESGADYRIDLSRPLDISIPLKFGGPQPNAYQVERASAEACISGDLVGDTRRGGSCNFERYNLIPHCNGTHTECVGHLTDQRISVVDCLTEAFLPACLVSVEPEAITSSGDSYSETAEETDRLITAGALEEALAGTAPSPSAIVVRTLPNTKEKLSRSYSVNVPPYFSVEAISFIVGAGIRHLVCDLPSVDRLYDRGDLVNHRLFWNVETGSRETNADSRLNNTITELAYVPDNIPDGPYALNLQIAPFESDASPSRPILFAITGE